MPDAPPVQFCALVPVKPVARAKSRLSPLGDEARRALVAAFAVDTVLATLESHLVGRVLVVTDDHVLAAALAEAGADVVPDAVADDLNGSLEQAAAEAHRRWPDLAPAALCADLPALRPGELSHALDVAARHRTAFVADAHGVGTTMVTATSAEDFLPRFGAGSREAHVAAGCFEIPGTEVPTLRRDVDTPGDLGDALELGVGPRTSLVAAGLTI